MSTDNDTMELTFLEEALKDDPKCQSSHLCRSGMPCGTVCSHNVIARKRAECNGKDFLICLNSYVWNMERLHAENNVCDGCSRHPSECWSLTLI